MSDGVPETPMRFTADAQSSPVQEPTSATIKDNTRQTLNPETHPFIPSVRNQEDIRQNVNMRKQKYDAGETENQNSSCNDDKHLLRDMAEMVARSKLPACEPGKYAGDKTEYVSWKNSMKSFIENKLSDLAEKISYLKAYTVPGSPARNVIAGYLNLSSQASLNSAWEKLDKIFGNPVHVSYARVAVG